jgi:hypothetical protein
VKISLSIQTLLCVSPTGFARNWCSSADEKVINARRQTNLRRSLSHETMRACGSLKESSAGARDFEDRSNVLGLTTSNIYT